MTTALLVTVAVLLAVLLIAFLLRRRFLLSGLGAVTMWLRRTGSPRWLLGVAWYGGDTLLWYRALSLSVRPEEQLCRSELRIQGRRGAAREDVALPEDVVVLTCQTGSGRQDLAMEPATVTGFLSWVESAPPGMR